MGQSEGGDSFMGGDSLLPGESSEQLNPNTVPSFLKKKNQLKRFEIMFLRTLPNQNIKIYTISKCYKLMTSELWGSLLGEYGTLVYRRDSVYKETSQSPSQRMR